MGSTASSCSACRTGIDVRRARSWSIRLLKSGDRCCRTTNAIPVSGGRWEKRRSSDSEPLADAPMPAIGNSVVSSVRSTTGAAGSVTESETCGPDSAPCVAFAPLITLTLSPTARERGAGQLSTNRSARRAGVHRAPAPQVNDLRSRNSGEGGAEQRVAQFVESRFAAVSSVLAISRCFWARG